MESLILAQDEMAFKRLVTSASITRDELPGIVNETVSPGKVREGDNLTGKSGSSARPISDRQTNATISVKGEKV